MWKKGAAAGFAAALLVAGIVLLRRVSGPSVDASHSPSAKVAEPRASSVAARSSVRPSAVVPVESRGSDEEHTAAARGPSAGVWQVLNTADQTVVQQREALVTALRAAPPCIETWCDEGHATLAAWQAAIAVKVPGALTADAIECSSAGCWMKVTVTDPAKWRDVGAALPAVTAEKPWKGPTIQGGPDFQTQRGAVISIWAILPNIGDAP